MTKSKISSILAMVFIICIGIFLILSPLGTLAGAIRVIGIMLIVIGVLGAVSYIWFGGMSVPLLIASIASVIIGIIFTARPYNIVTLLPIFAGVTIALNGVFNLIGAFELKKQGVRRWSSAAVMSGLAILLGILIFANPFSTMATLVRVIGIIVIYNGITGLMIALNS